MSNKSGYWSGMPGHLKLWAILWALYYICAATIFTQQPIFGTILMVIPGFWYLAKNWIKAEFFATLDVERKDTFSGYTVNYIFNEASTATRVVAGGLFAVLVLFGLGWISTEDLRLKAETPTISERVSGAVEVTKEATGEMVEGAKETTGGWIATAKGWFTGGDDDETPDE